jgi:uncharacterized protein with ParB-like and HNH nuclease domain
MKGIQDTSSETFRQLLGNGLNYVIPKFQRDYSWDTEQWDDLWQDLMGLLDNKEAAHYMGYLVLQTHDNKVFNVIDGQQRLTTLSILILAVLKNLKKLQENGKDADNNKIRRDTLFNSYIGYLDPVTLLTSNKLELNRNNNSFYRSYLTVLGNLPARGLNSSERLMKNCFVWFEHRVSEKFKEGKSLAGFIDNVVDKIFFTVIKVSDELNAFKVFETLNARGVQLSSADLLKNYLFSVADTEGVHGSELIDLEEWWSKVIDKLGNENFPEFLRAFWNSYNKTTRKNELFKAMRDSIKTKNDVFKLIRELNEKADIYMALNNPHDEFWKERPDKEVESYIEELNLFNVKQPIPLLIRAYEKLPFEAFKKLLKICSIISFRYNIIGGLNPNEQETAYNNTALSIYKNDEKYLSELKSIYPSDDSFENNFSQKEFKLTTRNKKIVRYIFSKIEKKLGGIDFYGTLTDDYTIEHIMPENPNETWQVSDEILEKNVNRIGNLTILEKNLNKSAENKSYAEKLEIFKQSTFKLNRFAEKFNDEWGERQIVIRQKNLAKDAKTIWRLDF